jgi:hypothetical protein
MSDAARLTETGNAFERALLASARGDRMSPQAKRALVTACTGGALAGGAAGVAGGALRDPSFEVGRRGTSGAAGAAGAGVAKWIALGGIAALALVGAISIAVHPRTVPSATRVPAAAPHEGTPSIPEQGPVNAPGNAMQTTVEPAQVVSPAPATPPSHPRPPASLAEELRIIERAQEARTAGRPHDALAALDEYAMRFPRGALEDEAAVLRIEANAQMGAGRLAARLASQFLATHPHSPYEARVRRVVSALDGASSTDHRP